MGNAGIVQRRILALACSIVLQAGLLVCLLTSSSTPPTPLQQVVDIQMATTSPPESKPAQTAEPETHPEPAKSIKTAEPVEQKKAASVETPKSAEESAKLPPASGPLPDSPEILTAITEPVYNAAYLHNVPPVYPESARNRGIEGEVMLEVNVTAEGTAREIAILHSSGYELLDKAALNAVTGWHFVPAKLGAKAMESKIKIPIRFRLD